MEHFLSSLKAGSTGVLKEIHSLVRDGTNRNQVNNKTNKTNKHKMNKHKINKEINISYYPIRYKKTQNLILRIM